MRLTKRIVIIGFGCIGQALLPLLIETYNAQIIIFEEKIDPTKIDIAEKYGALLYEQALTIENHHHILSPVLDGNTFLLNLAVSVSSLALIRLTQQFGALYLDTSIETWDYGDTIGDRYISNRELRESILKHASCSEGSSTALVAHGANPGFISILLKKAMLEMGSINGIRTIPVTQADWALLACNLELQVIQISERDTQYSSKVRKSGDFFGTWSPDGFITECLQPAELGWGSHERNIPPGAKKTNHALELNEQGRQVRVKSWSPNALEFSGYLLTHNESLSIADYLTIGYGETLRYRPTVYYAYHPCDQTVDSMHLLQESPNGKILSKQVMKESILSGIDELGIFLISKKYKSFWLGSNLSIGKAKQTADHNSATSLQVVSSIIGGMRWCEKNPKSGILESESLDWQYVYELVQDYWEPVIRQETTWRPIPALEDLLFEHFLA